MEDEGITPQDIWDFIQEHKDHNKDAFGHWCLGQHYRTTSKIMKAIIFWNDHVDKKRG